MKTSDFALKTVDHTTTPLAKIRLVLAVSAALLGTTTATAANGAELRLRTFIPAEAVNVDAYPSNYINGGDNRTYFSSSEEASYRTSQSVVLNFTPYGNLGNSRKLPSKTGKTTLFNKEKYGIDEGAPSWKWGLKPEAKPKDTAKASKPSPPEITRVPGDNQFPPGDDQFSVDFELDATNPLPPPVNLGFFDQTPPVVPSIDANITVDATSSAFGEFVDYEVSGFHDAFPAYEIYVDDNLIYGYNPLDSGNTPTSLVASLDKTISPQDKTIQDKTILTAPEPSSVLGTLAFGILGGSIMLKRKRRSKSV
ncbi:MAG: hypothetical protein BRC47_03365 [Cyanobacteria bacterium QS_7_48_42]|nr:MAG: hypothetical protein BRC47_03365 [Cyanobacteria bacterium QS_7_48_42]